MSEVVVFKRGSDLSEDTRIDEEDTVTCVDCGAVESDQGAYENGWQFAPPVCPKCLRWVLVDEACCSEGLV